MNDFQIDPAARRVGRSLLDGALQARSRFMKILLALVAIFLALTPFSERVFTLIAEPMMSKLPPESQMIAKDVASPFLTPLKATLWASVFLAMPIILAAFVFDLYKNIGTIDLGQGALIAIGFAAAFVSALVVVKTFLGFVSRHGYSLFGWWRIAVGAVGIAALLTFGS